MYTDMVWCLSVSLGASAAPVFAEDPFYTPSAALPCASLPLTAGTRSWPVSYMGQPDENPGLDDQSAVQYLYVSTAFTIICREKNGAERLHEQGIIASRATN